MRHRFHLLLALIPALLAACEDPNALADATIPNQMDTITLWSLSGGPLDAPSAYSLNARRGVRTWEGGRDFEDQYRRCVRRLERHERSGRISEVKIELRNARDPMLKEGLLRKLQELMRSCGPTDGRAGGD